VERGPELESNARRLIMAEDAYPFPGEKTQAMKIAGSGPALENKAISSLHLIPCSFLGVHHFWVTSIDDPQQIVVNRNIPFLSSLRFEPRLVPDMDDSVGYVNVLPFKSRTSLFFNAFKNCIIK
jgi:hypothetical protein